MWWRVRAVVSCSKLRPLVCSKSRFCDKHIVRSSFDDCSGSLPALRTTSAKAHRHGELQDPGGPVLLLHMLSSCSEGRNFAMDSGVTGQDAKSPAAWTPLDVINKRPRNAKEKE